MKMKKRKKSITGISPSSASASLASSQTGGLRSSLEKIWKSNRGETVIESIISMIILSILLVSVAMILQTAIKMTERSLEMAESSQEGLANQLILDEYEEEDDDVDFNISAKDATIDIDATHKVTLNIASDDIIAFYPNEDDD